MIEFQRIMLFVFTPLSIVMLVVGFIWSGLEALLKKDSTPPMYPVRLGLLGLLLTAVCVIFWWIFPLTLFT